MKLLLFGWQRVLNRLEAGSILRFEQWVERLAEVKELRCRTMIGAQVRNVFYLFIFFPGFSEGRLRGRETNFQELPHINDVCAYVI